MTDQIKSSRISALCVDDSLAIRTALILTFGTRSGFRVHAEGDTTRALEEAIDAAETDRGYGLLILGTDCSPSNGFDFCAKIKQIDFYRDTPVIFLLKHFEQKLVDRAQTMGTSIVHGGNLNELYIELNRITADMAMASR